MVDKNTLEERKEILQKTLDTFETYFLKDFDYIGGCDDITVADLMAICELVQSVYSGYDVTYGRPKLKAWIDRTIARLQPHFDEVTKEVIELCSDYRM